MHTYQSKQGYLPDRQIDKCISTGRYTSISVYIHICIFEYSLHHALYNFNKLAEGLGEYEGNWGA